VTDAEAIELGRIVAAWEGFRWAPGMRAIDGHKNSRSGAAWSRTVDGITGVEWHDFHGGCIDPVPDLRDRPTQAAVLEQIEKALSAPCHIQPFRDFVTDNGRKCWRVHCAGVFAHAGSRAEAIAAAARFLIANPPWYLDEKTRETGERWPAACDCFVNLDPDDYPDQPGCDRCGWAKQDHR